MESEDEGSNDEGDLGYFAEKRSYNFLLKDLEDEKPSKKAKSTEEQYAERRYEAGKRSPVVNLHHMLPVKTDSGALEPRSRVILPAQKPTETQIPEKIIDNDPKPTCIAELYCIRQQTIAAAKKEIAVLCCAITEDPYSNTAGLKRLRHYCSTEDSKAGHTIRKLALVSLTAVYNDILPSYPIHPSKELESLSKEVKQQHSYETELLRSYRVFLQLLTENLHTAFQTKREKEKKFSQEVLSARRSLGLLSLQCAGELLAKNYHFNLRSELLGALLPYGAGKKMGGHLARVVTSTVREVFEKDKQGECSVELVRGIAGIAKKKGRTVNGSLLECLQHVRLVELGEVRREKTAPLPDTSLLSKKQRKHRKEQAKVRQELLAAEAVESGKKQARLQAESLDHIFVTYFRVLKQCYDTPLLPIALAGLSKFAHLINVDFFTDLFECLKRLVKEEELELADSLNCVSTIFTILSGQGSVLEVDVGEFYSLLYQSLLFLTPSTPPRTFSLLHSTLHNAAKRQVPLNSQMAMVKRLCTMSTQLAPPQTRLLLVAARGLIRSSPRIADMLTPDQDFGKPYIPSASEPGQAHAEGAVLWELADLAQRAYHVGVRTTATLLTRYDPNSAKKSEVEHFLRKQDVSESDLCILTGDVSDCCKKMGNRRIKPYEELWGVSTDTGVLDTLLFYGDMHRGKTR